MSDHGYDDGLVHGHSWASESFARQPARREAPQRRHEAAAQAEDRYDDGLVHNHGWARNN